MRRAQSSIEVVLAITLLCIMLSAGGLGALSSWFDAELALVQLAADRAGSRGGDPAAAAQAVLPPTLHSAVRPHQWRER
jgi:hypothetical protein